MSLNCYQGAGGDIAMFSQIIQKASS